MYMALKLWMQLMPYNSPEQATKKCAVWEDVFAQVSPLVTISVISGCAELIQP